MVMRGREERERERGNGGRIDMDGGGKEEARGENNVCMQCSFTMML